MFTSISRSNPDMLLPLQAPLLLVLPAPLVLLLLLHLLPPGTPPLADLALDPTYKRLPTACLHRHHPPNPEPLLAPLHQTINGICLLQ